MKAEIRIMLLQTKEAQSPQKQEETSKDSLQSLQREYGPANALILDSCLQNSEDANFCYLKLPNLVVICYSPRKLI